MKIKLVYCTSIVGFGGGRRGQCLCEAHFIESFWMGNYWSDEDYYSILEREWKK